MKIIEQTRQQIRRILSSPSGELGRWARLFRFQIHLWRFCARRLRKNNATAMSAALSFRTIFALIPLLVLIILFLKSLGVYEQNKIRIAEFLEASNLKVISVPQPEKEQAEDIFNDFPLLVQDEQDGQIDVAELIDKTVKQVEGKLTFGRMGPVGVILLIWTALTLLTTLESSLNRIFGARQARPLHQRFLLYWSTVTLGPLLITTAAYLGDRFTEVVVGGIPFLSGLMIFVGWITPFISGLLLIATVYKLMPNTRVPTRAAIGGALVAVPLWLLAKYGFTLYVRHVVPSGGLYGTLGLLPLFLMWLNLSWLIVLFGAEVAHTAGNLHKMESAELAHQIVLGPLDRLAAAVVVARQYVEGHGAVAFDRICDALSLPDASVHQILDRLCLLGILAPADANHRNGYLMNRPPTTVSVLDVMEVELPEQGTVEPRQYSPEVDSVLFSVRQQARQSMGNMNLAEIAHLPKE